MVESITWRFFVQAGAAPDMRIREIGSGVGDAVFVAADLIDKAGDVTGIDQSAAALAIARTRALALGLGNVRFEETSLTTSVPTSSSTPSFGRYILMYMTDVAGVLRGLVQHLRPTGLLCVDEPSWASARSFPPVPSWDRCGSLVCRASTPKVDLERGSKLHTCSLRAGLAAPRSMQSNHNSAT
jgi:SAM-dependent methyltransferase